MNETIDAAVVILYNPSKEVWDNIATYAGYLKTLYIIDNSADTSSLDTADLEDIHPHAKLLHSGSNIGIAKALNLALRQAKDDRHRLLMTLDQDTSFQPKDIVGFIESIQRIKEKETIIISPQHNRDLIQPHAAEAFTEEKAVMTSANVVDVDLALQIGGYEEKLFIDEVDHAFCLKARKAGYRICLLTKIAVTHTLGTKSDRYQRITLYAPFRLYYMCRNYLYLKDKYYDFDPRFFDQRNRYLLKFFLKQLIFGQHRLSSIQMLFRGYRDYRDQKFGKLSHAH